MKRKNLTPADVAKYVKGDGAQCPYCGSENIQAGDTDTEQGGKYQQVECLNPECGASWVDVFHLVGIMPGTDDDGDGAIYADQCAPDWEQCARRMAEEIEAASRENDSHETSKCGQRLDAALALFDAESSSEPDRRAAQ
jgi:hypothetical protein